MRNTVAGLGAALILLTAVACGTADDGDSRPTGQSELPGGAGATVASAPPSESATGGAPAEPAETSADAGAVGNWTGTWSSAGSSLPATLTITAPRPLTASIDIPGKCGADWAEQSRSGEEIRVRATVTHGSCADNTWRVHLTGRQLTAVDTEDTDTRLTMTRR